LKKVFNIKKYPIQKTNKETMVCNFKHVKKGNIMKKNDLIIGLLAVVALIILTAKGTFAAEIPLGEEGDMRPLGAALAIGLAGIGSALGMGSAGSAGIGALVEKPEIFGKIFLFIVLIEAVAIYGLLVAILLIF